MFLEWHHENHWPRTTVKLILGTKMHHREDKLIPAKQDVLHEFSFTSWHRQLHTSSVFSREKSTVQLHSALKLHPDKARSSQGMSCTTRWDGRWFLIASAQQTLHHIQMIKSIAIYDAIYGTIYDAIDGLAFLKLYWSVVGLRQVHFGNTIIVSILESHLQRWVECQLLRGSQN